MKKDYDYLKSIFEKKDKPKETNETKETKETITQTEESNKFNNSKDQKLWQKEQEDKKRKENEDKGIDPKSLLTIENLKKWLIDEKRTFSYVAREYVGCKDSEVSSTAKAFNIECKKPYMYHSKK